MKWPPPNKNDKPLTAKQAERLELFGPEFAWMYEDGFNKRHRHKISPDSYVGCFYCCQVFRGKEIKKWVDKESTALCPGCGIDSVVLIKDFLEKARESCFGRPPKEI